MVQPDKPKPEPKVALNFSVDKEFSQEFKTFCEERGLKQVWALKKGFELLKSHLGGK